MASGCREEKERDVCLLGHRCDELGLDWVRDGAGEFPGVSVSEVWEAVKWLRWQQVGPGRTTGCVALLDSR